MNREGACTLHRTGPSRRGGKRGPSWAGSPGSSPFPPSVMNDKTIEQGSSKKPFEFAARVRSFRHAIRGIIRMIQCEHNAWVHATATLAVLVAGFFFHVSAGDWCWIILAISIVW